MDNKFVYEDCGKIWLSYEYWFLGFKRRSKRLLADLDFLGSDDLFARYPEGFREQLDSLLQYYKDLYQDG
jgi:hypothetical protein